MIGTVQCRILVLVIELTRYYFIIYACRHLKILFRTFEAFFYTYRFYFWNVVCFSINRDYLYSEVTRYYSGVRNGESGGQSNVFSQEMHKLLLKMGFN